MKHILYTCPVAGYYVNFSVKTETEIVTSKWTIIEKGYMLQKIGFRLSAKERKRMLYWRYTHTDYNNSSLDKQK